MRTNDLTTLAAAERHTRTDGDHGTAVPGLWLYRSSRPSAENAVVYVPSLCVVVQGAREVIVGGESYRYDPAQSLLVTLDISGHLRPQPGEEPSIPERLAAQDCRPVVLLVVVVLLALIAFSCSDDDIAETTSPQFFALRFRPDGMMMRKR